jgi:hypothetical protein
VILTSEIRFVCRDLRLTKTYGMERILKKDVHIITSRPLDLGSLYYHPESTEVILSDGKVCYSMHGAAAQLLKTAVGVLPIRSDVIDDCLANGLDEAREPSSISDITELLARCKKEDQTAIGKAINLLARGLAQNGKQVE